VRTLLGWAAVAGWLTLLAVVVTFTV